MTVRGTEQVRASFEDIRKSGEQTFGSLRRSAQGVGQVVDQTATAAVNTTKTAVTTATVGVGAIGTALSGLAGVASFVVSGILGIASAVAKGAVLVAGAAVGAYAAARSWTTSVAEGNDEVARQAQAIGMSVESLSRWQAAVRIAGGDANSVTGAFESVRNKMLDVAKGVEGADAAFRQLDIRVRDGNGGLKNSEVLFNEVVDQLAKIQDEGVRSAAAYDLFGSSATSLLPVLRRGSAGLRDLQRDAERYGTALDTAQAAENNALLEKKRRMDEALSGVSNRISAAFLPVFTNSAIAVSDWLANNGEAISRWAEAASNTFASLVRDVKRLFTEGTAAELENGWLADLRAPAEATRDVVLDLIDAMAGRGVSRAPWLADLADTAGEAWVTIKALLSEVRQLTGIGEEGFSIAQSFRDANAAMSSFRDGLEGNDGQITWASNIGRTVDQVGRAIGAVAGIVNDNRDAITAFATTTIFLLADGIEAIRGIINGEGVSETNSFAWLPSLVDGVLMAFDQIKSAGIGVWEEIVRNWDLLVSIGETIIGVMDGIAKALGLGDWKSLGIILVIGQITGAFRLLGTLSTVFAGVAVFLNNMVGFLGAVGGALGKVAFAAATFLAGLTGLPALVVLAIGAVIAGIIALVIIFWDDIGNLFRAGWDLIVSGFRGIADLIGAIFGGLGELLGAIFGGFGDVASAAWNSIAGAFGSAGDFFRGIVDGIGNAWNGFWSGIGSGAQAAWDGVTGVFSGIIDFFSDPLARVGDMWNGLWDGIKNGAVGAWDSVKSFFGFGGAEQQDGSLPSYDVGTARVPGADGQPMKALIHGGERILTVDENKRFGALLDSLMNLTTLPTSPFAMAPAMATSPARGGSGSGMQAANINLGRRGYGLQGSPSVIRDLQSGLRRNERFSAAPRPRHMR